MNFSSSERVNLALDKMGIVSVETLIEHLPRSYNDFHLTHETNLENKERVVIFARLVSNPTIIKKGKLTIIRFSVITKNNNFFRVVIFNRPYIYKMLNLANYYTIVGTFDKSNMTINVMNIVKGEIPENENYKAIYSLPSAIENYQFAKMVQKYLLNDNYNIPNIIPNYLMEKYHLVSRKEAFKLVHIPKNAQDVHQGLRALKYEECLLFTLQTQIIRKENKSLQKNTKLDIDTQKINEFIKALDYKLTHDQVIAVREIILDMKDKSLMYRLLQGDVGTGKTLVANIAIYGAFLRHDQAVLMAPTDALARQHFDTLTKLFNGILKVDLLVGGMSISEKKEVKERIVNHKVDVIVGTHAVFSKDVNYASLGLAVIDEQHKFGVNQRMLLASKGTNTDLLLMSATPIPRSLAQTIYGDTVDVYTIESMPKGRMPIKTATVHETNSMFNFMKEEIEHGHQCYMVCPLIENSNSGDDKKKPYSVEEVLKMAEGYFCNTDTKIGCITGKMKDEEKEEIKQKFKNNEYQILIATTIIEVGINVPNATVICIMNAERFGLAGLHQLRGRVGRNSLQSYCILYSEDKDNPRLDVMCKTSNGFEIAEEDLKLRGTGDIIGIKQSGEDESIGLMLKYPKLYKAMREYIKANKLY